MIRTEIWSEVPDLPSINPGVGPEMSLGEDPRGAESVVARFFRVIGLLFPRLSGIRGQNG